MNSCLYLSLLKLCHASTPPIELHCCLIKQELELLIPLLQLYSAGVVDMPCHISVRRCIKEKRASGVNMNHCGCVRDNVRDEPVPSSVLFLQPGAGLVCIYI